MQQQTETAANMSGNGNLNCGPIKPIPVSYSNYKKSNGQTAFGLNTNIGSGGNLQNTNNNNSSILLHSYSGS